MRERKYKLGAIPSSIALINHTLEIAEELDEDIKFSMKGLDDSIPARREMEDSGVEVIVRRGGHLISLETV